MNTLTSHRSIPGFSGHIPKASAAIGLTHAGVGAGLLHDQKTALTDRSEGFKVGGGMQLTRREAPASTARPPREPQPPTARKVPGYSGYVKQGKQIGKSFGMMVNEESGVANQAVESSSRQSQRGEEQTLVRSGIPGYTGRVPGRKDNIGQRYAKVYAESEEYLLNSMRTDGMGKTLEQMRKEERRNAARLYPLPQTARPSNSSRSLNSMNATRTSSRDNVTERRVVENRSVNSQTSSKASSDRDSAVEPFATRRQVPVEKSANKFLPGYTGYVRGSEHYIGVRFAKQTELCLNELHGGMQPGALSTDRPLAPRSGTIPGYSGHVMGSSHAPGANYAERTKLAQKNSKVLQVTPKDRSDSANARYSVKEAGREVLPLVTPRSVKRADSPSFKVGYTGYLPGKQHFVGTNYHQMSHDALQRYHNNESQ